MVILDCVQNTPDWFQARVGIPTASNFDKIITSKGEPSKTRIKYMYQLAGERITNKYSEDIYQTPSMLRGIQMEEEARSLYEMLTGKTVIKVGLCKMEGGLICGASPDGLVDENGGIEIKCPMVHTHIEYLLNNKLPTEYFQQVQGELFVTGREWIDFISYYPGIKPFILRVEPDKEFHKKLRVELEIFCNELNELTERLR